METFVRSLNYILLVWRGKRCHTVWGFISFVDALINTGVTCLLLHHSLVSARFRIDPQSLLEFLIVEQRIHFHSNRRLNDTLWALIVVGWWWGVIPVTASIRTHKRSTTSGVMQISIDLIPIHLKHRERDLFIFNSEMWHILLIISLLHWKRWLKVLLFVVYKEVRAIGCLVVLKSIGVVSDYL